MTPNEIETEYNSRLGKYKQLKDEVLFLLNNHLERNSIPYDAMYGRIKEIESLKIKIRDNEYDKPFDQIYDICGVRVVCLFPSHLEMIDKVIMDNLTVHKRNDKIHSKPAESFGYLSIHYKAVLSDSLSGPRYDDLKSLKFEVQLRTIAAHAWCDCANLKLINKMGL